ncbi:MAG: ABC-F family ATP-binding cassette domain-containing protein [Candidatus Pacebacteria bacterium]|nr:ABC-F family ATP-binding cassette domain-containing protein [Candidatus Paceibacterota bacterium]
MIKVTKLSKSFGQKTVLNKISFNLEKGNMVALTGFNGSGKTTLLNIMAGNESFSNGLFQMQDNIRRGFVPQDPIGHNEMKVIDFLVSNQNEEIDDAFLRKIDVMLAGFLIPENLKQKKIGELSSGQKTKIFLTNVLLQDVDLLLLDEPTNNLDLPALIWLEDFLQNFKGACIVVSHDKTFLDNVTNKVFEIDWEDHSLRISNAKYTDYLSERQLEFNSLNQKHSLQREEVQRLKHIVVTKQEKGRLGAKWKGTDNDKILRGFKRNRAGASLKDAHVTMNRIKRMDFIDKPKVRKDLSLEIEAEINSPALNIVLKDVMCGYENDFSVGPVSLDVSYGKKVCIVGPNGVGKTTILKTITGMIPALSGKILIDGGVSFGNFMQEHETLPKEKTLVDFLKDHVGQEREIIQNHLVKFGFSEEDVISPIKFLSPGGRARLLFAYFTAVHVNTLILDEPTNHLDIEAEEALEEALKNFTGTVIAVSHDRNFVKKMNFDDVFVVSESGFEKLDSFDDYVAEMEKKSKKLIRMLGK